MYTLASNEEIGKYLGNLITAKYEKDRRFAIKYLEIRDGNCNPSQEDIQKMANKICQIKYGNKGIQIADLPIFSQMLDVSVDSILSGGKVLTGIPERLTNYSVAMSDKEEEWIEYINRSDKAVLNPDEFGKTILDYSFDFKNYKLLKFLVNEGYIWFVDKDSTKFSTSFWPGTKIERRAQINTDILGIRMKESDQPRRSMITLALEKADFEILDELHAREIPILYEANSIGSANLEIKEYYDKKMIEEIASNIDEVGVYFSEEFKIKSNGIGGQQFTFTFPFLGKLIEAAVRNKSKSVTILIKNAIKHNKNVLKMIDKAAKQSADGFKDDKYAKYYDAEYIEAHVMDHYHFFLGSDTVSFYPRYADISKVSGVFSNVIKVSASSKDVHIQSLIEELNESYRAVAEYYYKE